MKIIKEYKWVSKCVMIDSWFIWPTVVLFWWTHWDEKSWVLAVNKIYNEIIKNELLLKKWRLILVSEANEKAVNIWVRYVDYNLNRLFKDDIYWDWYEYYRSFELKSILDEADYFIDLHSTSSPSTPFLFSEKQCLEVAKKLWVWYIISWWNAVWELTAWDTEVYVNKKWWIWFTFESWDHNSIEWVNRTYQISLNLMSINWLLDINLYEKLYEYYQNIEIIWFHISISWKFKYMLDNIESFVDIKKWQLIWLDWDKNIFAEQDIVLIMPTDERNIKKWEEVFFIWKKLK